MTGPEVRCDGWRMRCGPRVRVASGGNARRRPTAPGDPRARGGSATGDGHETARAGPGEVTVRASLKFQRLIFSCKKRTPPAIHAWAPQIQQTERAGTWS